MQPLTPQELGRLYRQHAPALRLYARQWPGVAEDAVQDAFVALATQSPPPNRVLPWLFRVVRTGALESARSMIRRRRREGIASTAETWFSMSDQQLDAQEAAKSLADLPLELREVIVARLWGELTFEEISRLAGCSLPTAHRRYQTGLTELRKRLDRSCTQMRTT